MTLLGDESTYGERKDLAEKLEMTDAAVRMAIHRLRRRFRELLREDIAQTVAGPDDVDDEIRHLFAALGS